MLGNLIARVVHKDAATIPVPRADYATNRQTLVLERARDNPGDYDIEFIGDSTTQEWESAGKNVWQKYYGKRKVINMGVTGDRTQHVLWRIDRGQLDGIRAKIAVVMIGTNNSNNQDNSESEILAGVTAVVQQIRMHQPETRILLLGILPRGRTFCNQRGKILQVNQALAQLDDGKQISYLDMGSRFIGNDGSISQNIMPDYLHLSEAGYKIWAESMEPRLGELLNQ